MKFISWNVNGVRAVAKKGFVDIVMQLNPDFIAIQESKCQEGQIELDLEGYFQYWNYAERKGYSGTAIFTKHKALSVVNGIGVEKHDNEGRVITLEYDKYYLVTVYTPNSKRTLERLEDRQDFEDEFRDYLLGLKAKKSVIMCGDLNVAHKEIDLTNPKTNKKNAGFTIEERTKLTELLEVGFIDSFRVLYPDLEGAYSWWSYMHSARSRNIGWRLDYFILSDDLKSNISKAYILPDVLGSDHCPVGVELDI